MRSILTCVIGLWALVQSVPVAAQTRSTGDAVTAYRARLTAKGAPAALNKYRVNNRVSSRIDTRLGLRIERYRPEMTANPTAAFEIKRDDQSRTAPVIAPPTDDEPQ